MTEFPEEAPPVLQPEKWDELGLSHHMKNILTKIEQFKSKRSSDVIDVQRAEYEKQIAERKNTIIHEHFEQINECCSQVGYCCTRLQKFSPDSKVKSLKDYIWLNDQQIDEKFKAEHGKAIYTKIVALMKVLHYQRKYPKDLIKSFIVRPLDQDVQLFASQFTTTFDEQQFLLLAKFLMIEETVPQFFIQKQQFSTTTNITEVAKIVNDASQLTLDKVGTIFIKDGKPLANNEILTAFRNLTLDDKFWTLMVRFGQQQEAIIEFSKLPIEFQDYLERKKDVPSAIQGQFPGQDAVEIFRLCLGMYPTHSEFAFKDQQLQSAVQKLPIWYRNRLEQIAMVTQEFVLGSEMQISVDKITCPADQLKQLVEDMM